MSEMKELQRELEYTKKSLDGMREQREHWADEAIEMFRAFFPHDEYCVPNSPSKMVIPKINEMQKKLDELEKFDHNTSLAAFGDNNEELRKLLSRAAKLLDNAEQDRDANYANWMDCKAKVVQANATIDELQAKLDEAEFAIANWREREMSLDESERLREELRQERDELLAEALLWSENSKRVAHHVGWLKGFSSTIWTLVGEHLADETAAEYDRIAGELQETLFGKEGE